MVSKEKIVQAESEWKGAVDWFYSDEKIKTKESQKLDKLWKKALPMTDEELYAVRQITWLSKCNWNLEPSIKSIIEAIGKGSNSNLRIGHNYSITPDRWKKAWAYYLSLKKWLPTQGRYSGFPVLLDFCDPDKLIRAHIVDMLGKQTKLKELYVELFSYFLEFHLMGRYSDDSTKMLATKAAITSLTSEVKKHDYDKMILAAVQIKPEELSEGTLSWYEICHHKFFRRCDITLSSIGANNWRGAIKEKGTDKEELQELLLRYSLALDAWITNQDINAEFTKNIKKSLGKQTKKKLFQVCLLNAFLKGQME
ncbi:MAG: hypothetical protein FK730_17245 [Asgard group archaeon]|nr:hypothetical protein [Asgard group archaeon]